MTAHELAKKLLDGPDFVVVVEDGLDPSNRDEVTRADVIETDYNPAVGYSIDKQVIYLS